MQEFRNLDRNRDGVLSGNEVWDDLGSPQTWTGTTFARLDTNRDGQLSTAEWRGDRQLFRQADRNGDNRVSRGEFMNANVEYEDTTYERANYDRFIDADRNGDNRIERSEWEGTRAAFERLDVNNDGVLSHPEYRAGRAASRDAVPAGLDSFDALDMNNNEVISRNEWRGNYGEFNRFDINRDGVVSRREYQMTGNGNSETTIRVDSREPWTDTGIYVQAGDVIGYRAAGSIQMSTNPDDRATPAGALSGRNANNSPRPDQRAGALLFRVGNGSVGVLGVNGTFRATNSGELFLGVNDDHFPDNAGEYQVMLTHTQR